MQGTLLSTSLSTIYGRYSLQCALTFRPAVLAASPKPTCCVASSPTARYLFFGLADTQGRFEEALSAMHLVITSNLAGPRPPSRDRTPARGPNLNDSQDWLVTAQQIRAYSKIALFMADGSETHRPSQADLDILFSEKRVLFPTQVDLVSL